MPQCPQLNTKPLERHCREGEPSIARHKSVEKEDAVYLNSIFKLVIFKKILLVA